MLTQAPNQPQRSEFARRGTKQERRQSASRQYETPHSCWKGWRVKQILLDSGVRRGCLACLGEFLVIAQRKNYNTVTSLTFSRSLAQPEPLVLHDYINTSLILTLDTLSSAFSPSNFLPQLSAVLSTRVQHVVAFLTRCRLNHLPQMTRSLPRSINLGRISHGNRRQPRKYTLMNVVNTKQTDQSSRLIASGSTMIDLASKEKKSIRVFHVHKALLCFYSIPRQIAQRILCRRHYPMSTTDRSRSQSRILRLFFTWLYSGNVDLTLPKLDGSNTSYYWMIVTKFYIFADSINCVALQRSIMSSQPMHFHKECKTLPPPSAIELLSATTLESSHLYQYMVDCYQSHWDRVWQDDDQTEDEIDEKAKNGDPLPPNFAYRILVRGLAVRKEQKHDRCRCCYDRCFYHGHGIWNSEERGASKLKM